jgi:hypothetical protein
MRCTLLRVDNGAAFVADAVIAPNADGSVSFVLPGGQYAGQEPRQYGVRHDGPDPQQYQRARLEGNLVVFVTRPEDPPFVYLIGQGQVYPA